MSVFNAATAVCGKCGAESRVELAASVNADRREDLRAAILDSSFQATKCEKCGSALRLPAHLIYLDIGRGQWILVESAEMLPHWQETEQEAQTAYDLAFGADAPEEAREIGAELKPRLVFGWPALREKLIAGDLGLDDTTLELLKMSVIANVGGAPMADQSELRLTGGDAEKLDFAWIVGNTEQVLATLDVPREEYDAIVDDAEDWAALKADLTAHMFVDIQRSLSGSGAPREVVLEE
jgi:hypothetical protein